jgi:hypothetical protein
VSLGAPLLEPGGAARSGTDKVPEAAQPSSGGAEHAARPALRAGGKLLMNEVELASCMCQAVSQRNHAVLAMYMKAGANPLSRNYDERTPLHVAAAEGDLEALKIMVDETHCKIDPHDRWVPSGCERGRAAPPVPAAPATAEQLLDRRLLPSRYCHVAGAAAVTAPGPNASLAPPPLCTPAQVAQHAAGRGQAREGSGCGGVPGVAVGPQEGGRRCRGRCTLPAFDGTNGLAWPARGLRLMHRHRRVHRRRRW